MSNKMTVSDWNKLKYFHSNENWGNPFGMDKTFMFFLDDLRGYVGRPFVVNCGTQGRHSSNSFHYKGRAVDGCFLGLSPIEALDIVMEKLHIHGLTDKVGVGFYPHWNTPGLHIDDRNVDGTKPPVFWVRLDRRIDFTTKLGYHYRDDAWKIVEYLKENGMR